MRSSIPIALAILACGCGGSGYGGGGGMPPPPCTAATATATTQVDIQGMAFVPACIKVTAGAMVTFTNKDAMLHTATADSGSGSPSTPDLAQNQSSAPQTFATAGTVPYHCTIHPGMKGTVIVE
jgi:plastocyanin